MGRVEEPNRLRGSAYRLGHEEERVRDDDDVTYDNSADWRQHSVVLQREADEVRRECRRRYHAHLKQDDTEGAAAGCGDVRDVGEGAQQQRGHVAAQTVDHLPSEQTPDGQVEGSDEQQAEGVS